MSDQNFPKLPQVGDLAPEFEFETQKGLVKFPEYSAGCWCIFFAHPANFTSAWTMYSSFLAMKERFFNERNTKLLALVNEPIKENDFQDIVRRYIGIYLKAPIIEDPDFAIANLYGLAHGRRWLPGCDRLILVIDPEGIIRLILNRPLPSIENAIMDVERELDRMQNGYIQAKKEATKPPAQSPIDLGQSPKTPPEGKGKVAYFSKKEFNFN